MSFNQEEFINQLSGLTSSSLVHLTKALEDKWGVKAAPVAVAAARPGAAGSGRLRPSPDRVHRRPQGRRRNRIGVIKVVREVTGLGLKDAKDLVDGAPKDVKVGVNKTEADEMVQEAEGSRRRDRLK